MSHFHLKSAVFPLLFVILLDSFGWGVVYPILTPVIIQNSNGIFTHLPSINIRNFWYEAMIGLYCLCLFCTSPFLGGLSDAYGRKFVLMLSMFGMASGFFISALGLFLKSFALLLIGRLIAGCTAGSLPIAQAALMDISTQDEKPKRMSWVALCNVGGFAMGPVLGGFFLDEKIWGSYVNYATPFLVCALLALFGAGLLFFLFKETYTARSKERLNAWTGFENLYLYTKHKKTRTLCLVFFIFMLAWALFFSTEPLLLVEQFNWSPSLIGYFMSFGGVVLAFGVVCLMPWLIKKTSLEMIVFYSFLAMLVCSIFFPMIRHPAWLWVLIALTIAVPFGYIGIATLSSQAVSANEQGKIMGVFNSYGALAWGIGPLLGGNLIQMGLKVNYLVAAVLFLVCLLWFRSGDKDHQ